MQTLASVDALVEYPQVAGLAVGFHGLAQRHTIAGFALLTADMQQVRQAILVQGQHAFDAAGRAFLSAGAAGDAEGKQLGRERDDGGIGPA